MDEDRLLKVCMFFKVEGLLSKEVRSFYKKFYLKQLNKYFKKMKPFLKNNDKIF